MKEIKSDRSKTKGAKSGSLKVKRQKLKAKVLNTYYGKPVKDMKVIAVTGSVGSVAVAHFVHEILRAAGKQVAILAAEAPFKTGILHKFLSDAWKAGANYVVVTVPAEGLRDNTFYGLPIHIAAMTNFVTSGLKDMTAEEFLDNEKTLFDMKPNIVILNKDDLNYPTFESMKGKEATITFGQINSDVKIVNSKLYTMGTEATLAASPSVLSVATFLTGETAVSYMACATAIAKSLGIADSFIVEGIANYDPEQ